MPWRLHIKDKTEIKGKNDEKLCCPPHTFPHKLPFTKYITDEPCHYHNAKWRHMHHVPFCKYLKCPNFNRMIEKYKEDMTTKKDRPIK